MNYQLDLGTRFIGTFEFCNHQLNATHFGDTEKAYAKMIDVNGNSHIIEQVTNADHSYTFNLYLSL